MNEILVWSHNTPWEGGFLAPSNLHDDLTVKINSRNNNNTSPQLNRIFFILLPNIYIVVKKEKKCSYQITCHVSGLDFDINNMKKEKKEEYCYLYIRVYSPSRNGGPHSKPQARKLLEKTWQFPTGDSLERNFNFCLFFQNYASPLNFFLIFLSFCWGGI